MMKPTAKAILQGALVGCVAALGPIAAMLAGSPAPAEQGAPGAEVRAGVLAGCRWEVVSAGPWNDGPQGPVPPAPHAVTLLLDQCSGRTWVLVSGRGGLEWRAIAREWPGP